MIQNRDDSEVKKFNDLADDWWNPTGQFKPLHEINPLRLAFIESHVSLANKKIIDVGCGGGILTEALALREAEVTGIDLAESVLTVAKNHATDNQLTIDYQFTSAEEFAAAAPHQFDVVTCMELLEHVPNPESLVAACATLVKPGGWIFFSTINRHPTAYLMAIVGAEYILKLLPRGTHDYQKFLKPAELGELVRRAGLTITQLKGMSYNPLTRRYSLSQNLSVNYLMACQLI